MSSLFGPRLRYSLCRNLLTIVSVLCLSLSAGGQAANGAIIVTFGTSVPDPLPAGSSGYVDVFVAASAATEALDGFVVELAITPGGGSPGPVGGLIFSASQAEAQLGIGGPTGYVFFGNSLSQNVVVPIGIVTGGGTGYTGADFTFNLVPTTLTTTPMLLYRMDLSAVAVGTYVIDVVSASTQFVPDQTMAGTTPFSSMPGGMTVGPAAAVPEPATAAFLLVGLGGVALRRRFFRRQPTV